jgi:UPF0716 protein FxsA
VRLLLLVLFVVVPVVEIYVLIQVGQLIGVGPTIVLLLVDAALGTWLFGREGRKAWAALNQAIAARRVPAKEVADGALVVLGGAFLITPGFVSDVVGVLCLLPPTRALLRRGLTRFLAARMLGPSAGPGPARRSRLREAEVVEGEVVEDEPDT